MSAINTTQCQIFRENPFITRHITNTFQLSLSALKDQNSTVSKNHQEHSNPNRFQIPPESTPINTKHHKSVQINRESTRSFAILRNSSLNLHHRIGFLRNSRCEFAIGKLQHRSRRNQWEKEEEGKKQESKPVKKKNTDLFSVFTQKSTNSTKIQVSQRFQFEISDWNHR